MGLSSNRTIKKSTVLPLIPNNQLQMIVLLLLGVLLGEMIQNMKNFKNNPESSNKLHVYSAVST